MKCITTSKVTGKRATTLAAEFALISREQGHDVEFTHGGLFRYGSQADLADVHVVARHAERYFASRKDRSAEAVAKRVADGLASDYARAFGFLAPGSATHTILSLTGYGETAIGGAQ